MKLTSMTARKLRVLLLLVMLVVGVAAIGGFYFMQKQLRNYASDISQLKADADSGGQNLATLRRLSTELDEREGTIRKTKDIVAESKEYVYQDKIIEDLTEIGKSTGVTITGFTFSAAAAAATTTAPTGTSAPQTQAPASTGSTLKSQTVTVSIANPVNYNTLMNFIKKIELNSFKMQIASVSITKGEGSQVTSESFIIEVYVR